MCIAQFSGYAISRALKAGCGGEESHRIIALKNEQSREPSDQRLFMYIESRVEHCFMPLELQQQTDNHLFVELALSSVRN